MSPLKIKQLEEALDTEYSKWGTNSRFTTRFRMLELQLDIEIEKNNIKIHEELEKSELLKDDSKKLNKEILANCQSNLKKLIRKAEDL